MFAFAAGCFGVLSWMIIFLLDDLPFSEPSGVWVTFGTEFKHADPSPQTGNDDTKGKGGDLGKR